MLVIGEGVGAMKPIVAARNYVQGRQCHREYVRSLTNVAEHVEEFSAQAINSYLRARLASVRPITVSNERRQLLTVWRWAWNEGHVDQPPRGVIAVRTVLPPVKAWSISECCALVKGAEKFRGKRLRNGADLGAFLQCWVVLAYETGARYGDVFAWKEDNFRQNSVGWVTSKTGVVCTRFLSDKAMDLVHEMLKASTNGTVLGWVCCRRQSFRFMRRLLKDSGFPGSGRWLRRSSATHVEMHEPGKAQWFLAHKSPGMAARHYLDQTQLSGQHVRPPAIV
jgi:integrase